MLSLTRIVVRTSACFLSVFAAIATAHADPITITIVNQSAIPGMPGGNVTVFGTLTNSMDTALHINSSGGSTFDVRDATFYIRPDRTTYFLQPGETTGIVPFVTLLLFPETPTPLQPGGRIEFCGGSSATACDPLGAASFSIRVGAAPAPVPEPASLILFATGGVGVMVNRLRKRRKAAGAL